MSIIRVGTTKKYSDGWEAAFAGRKGGKSSAGGTATAVRGKSKKKAAKKAKR